MVEVASDHLREPYIEVRGEYCATLTSAVRPNGPLVSCRLWVGKAFHHARATRSPLHGMIMQDRGNREHPDWASPYGTAGRIRVRAVYGAI
jgi:hypothetical protein